MTQPDFLDTPSGRRIAYRRSDGTGPGVVFLGGFMSDMDGTKAVHLEAWAAARGRAFLRLDYSGHGQSGGAFEEGCIGDWAADAQAVIEAVTEGPLLLVGSSMGVWIGCLMTQRLGARVAGFVGIAGAALAAEFDELDSLHMRVGALPLYPTNALKYNLTWSTDGLINEYCNPCDAIVDGERVKTAPLEDYELLGHDGVEYECFNTSGGLGTLPETLAGKARDVSYRSIRYPGHCDILKLLLNDLGLERRRDLLKEIFESALPRTDQDVVLVYCTAKGRINGELREKSLINKTYSSVIDGQVWGAIQTTTAAGVLGVVDLMRSGALPSKGFVRQEQVKLADFLNTEFGSLYRAGDVTERHKAA